MMDSTASPSRSPSPSPSPSPSSLLPLPSSSISSSAFSTRVSVSSRSLYGGDVIVSPSSPSSLLSSSSKKKKGKKKSNGNPHAENVDVDVILKNGNGNRNNKFSSSSRRLSPTLSPPSFDSEVTDSFDSFSFNSLANPIVGTSKSLEKDYFRLTSPPIPSSVRNENTLKLSLSHVKKKWCDESVETDYEYFCSQMKSIRQDLQVQHIVNHFTLLVYETHARMALESGDINEFHQCQSQLHHLYTIVPVRKIAFGERKGKGEGKGAENENHKTHWNGNGQQQHHHEDSESDTDSDNARDIDMVSNSHSLSPSISPSPSPSPCLSSSSSPFQFHSNYFEFCAYKILHYCALNRYNDLHLIHFINDILHSYHYEMESLPPPISHAIHIRQSLNTNNYKQFFQLYPITPNMGNYLLDVMVEKLRIKSLLIMCYAYKPHVLLSHMQKMLAFESVETGETFLKEIQLNISKIKGNGKGNEDILFIDSNVSIPILESQQEKWSALPSSNAILIPMGMGMGTANTNNGNANMDPLSEEDFPTLKRNHSSSSSHSLSPSPSPSPSSSSSSSPSSFSTPSLSPSVIVKKVSDWVKSWANTVEGKGKEKEKGNQKENNNKRSLTSLSLSLPSSSSSSSSSSPSSSSSFILSSLTADEKFQKKKKQKGNSSTETLGNTPNFGQPKRIP